MEDIINYINTNLSSCIDSLEAITIIGSLLKKINYDINNIDIIVKNEIVSKIISDYLSNNGIDNINSSFIDVTCIELIEYYCYINDINLVSDNSDLTALYYKDISRIKKLTEEENIELLKKVKAGDSEARQKFIEANLRLAIGIAKLFKSKTTKMSFLDLVEEANMALILSVDTYDMNSGYRFSTYAYTSIRRRLYTMVCINENPIKKPIELHYKYNQFIKKLKKLTSMLGRYPTNDEIINHLHISESLLIEFLNIHNYPISLQEKIEGDNDSVELESMIVDENSYFEEKVVDDILKKDLNKSLKKILSEDEYKLIDEFYGLRCEAKKRNDMAKENNVSRTIIFNRVNKILEKLSLDKEIQGYALYANISSDNIKPKVKKKGF